ncbi:nucleotide disphospho-sugar-binding domain-containing protein [Kutzneria buriramensis]|uniref:UDP:flavonoid glycosyltransferase YjiC (YdhE family) n=1 Tax=Kutzneria buriramensis TaxID=1045776 RepID=A0A3E0H056_9PSEU|nr:nucleotide disphospho-sugar-binding domain-containing protein [Kutzneria buriramensis]REH35702.1 UDP:flavonoid glycosyltransferase YjiC (YdhE family) [Kutzneria buriramensis]
MRVLLASWGWPSHYFPLVPTGWAFRSAGHDVRVATQPGLVDVVLNSGLPAVAVGRDIDVPDIVRKARERLAPGARPAAPFFFDPYLAAAESMVDDLLRRAESERPDLVVYEPTTYAAPLVAARLGIPRVRQLWGPDFLWQLRDRERAALAPLAERLGLDGISPATDDTLDPCPAGMRVATEYRRHPVRYVPYNGNAAVPDLPPRGDRPRVCVTIGSTLPKIGGQPDSLGETLAALADFDVVLATSAPPSTAVPPHVTVMESVPFTALLPTCDVLVHQGGPGTMMTALALGVPQLVLPSFLPEQPFYADKIVRQGAALALRPASATATAVADRVARLVRDPAFRSAAARLRAENDALPSPADAVSALAHNGSSHVL